MIFFAFESDFVDTLRCIPMIVRRNLDVAGIKLKLNEWSKLPVDARSALASAPCRTPDEITAYRAAATQAVTEACGAPPASLPPIDPQWENAGAVPAQVAAQAAAHGLSLSQQFWASLSPLQRFALLKLSRSGHENLNFLPALREFGFPLR